MSTQSSNPARGLDQAGFIGKLSALAFAAVPDDDVDANAVTPPVTPPVTAEGMVGPTPSPTSSSAVAGAQRRQGTQSTPNLAHGSDVLARVLDDLADPTPPVYWPLGVGDFARYRFGPGAIFVVVAPPNAFKSVLLSQWYFTAMHAATDLVGAYFSADLPEEELVLREVSRLGGVPYGDLLDKRIGHHADRIAEARRVMSGPFSRTIFDFAPSPDIAAVAAAVRKVDAKIVALDYLQCFTAGQRDELADVKAVMSTVAELADEGRGILIASAATRDAARNGATLQAGRGGSEIEHRARDLFALDGPDVPANPPTRMMHLKTRRGVRGGGRVHHADIRCVGQYQRVDALGDGPEPERLPGLGDPLADMLDITPEAVDLLAEADIRNLDGTPHRCPGLVARAEAEAARRKGAA